MSRLLNANELAEILNVPVETIAELTEPRGPFPVVKVKKKKFYDLDEVLKMAREYRLTMWAKDKATGVWREVLDEEKVKKLLIAR